MGETITPRFTKELEYDKIERALKPYKGYVILVQNIDHNDILGLEQGKLEEIIRTDSGGVCIELGSTGIPFARGARANNVARVVGPKQEVIYEDKEVVEAWNRMFSLRSERNFFTYREIQQKNLLKAYGIKVEA